MLFSGIRYRLAHMMMRLRDQSGFHLVLLLLFFVVLGAIITAGSMVFHNSQKKNTPASTVWVFDENSLRWHPKTGTAPSCKTPYAFDRAPIDMTRVSAVLMPGAYRGYSYKPHGGFGVTDTQGVADIKMPVDATLVGITRYYEESKDLQYLLTFETDCGIAFRFDHLYKLSPELQKLAEKTPAPKVNDTRSDPTKQPPRTKFSSGKIIATQVGMPTRQLYGFDFGVYDYRKQNDISKNPKWATIHDKFQSQEWFGVCWFDMLPATDAQTIKQLSTRQIDTRKVTKITSDYCANAPYKTLDRNDGQPTID